jgi:hypothetical protein
MADTKRLFYTDRSTYQNRFSTYEDKCERLDFNNLRQTLDAARVAVERADKVECSALEQVSSKAMEYFQAAKPLRDDAYRNTSDRVPDKFVQLSEQAGKFFEEANSRRASARDKGLCR